MARVAPTSQVSEAISTGALKEQRKAVVIMKIDAVSQVCLNASVVLGQRDGVGFKATETLRVAGPRVPNRSNVAEAELTPGEYHVVAYSCHVGPRVATMARFEGGKYQSSYASFAVGAGEIVNVGHLKLRPLTLSHAVGNVRVTNNVVQVVVTDWAMSDLDGFKQERPALYKQMVTRLAAVTKVEPMTAAERQQLCERAKGLQAEGKVQNLPPICTAPAGDQPPMSSGQPGKSSKPAIKA